MKCVVTVAPWRGVIHQAASEQSVLKIDVMEAGKIGKSIRIWVTLTCDLGQSISRTVGRVVCSRYTVVDTYQKWFKDRQLARGSGNQRNKSDLMLVMLLEADLSAAKKSSPSRYSFVYQKVTRFLKSKEIILFNPYKRSTTWSWDITLIRNNLQEVQMIQLPVEKFENISQG